MSAISFQNVNKRFLDKEAVRAFTAEIPRGQVTVLLGSNGAGKTTTIKLLMGLLRQNSGTIHVLGTDSRCLKPADFQRVGYVSENQKLPLWMTVQQFLDYCRPLYPQWDRALEADLLAQFELDLRQKLQHLSRGQLMKVALLSSLAYRPALVVLDEPFSGLDPVARDGFSRGLLQLSSQEGVTVFISSHDLEDLERLVDHVTIMDTGKLAVNESALTLAQRVRHVELTLHANTPIPTHLPASWISENLTGRILRFTHTAWDDAASPPEITQIFGSSLIGPPTAHSLKLREIFVALSKQAPSIQVAPKASA